MKNIPFILTIAVKPFLILALLITISLIGFSRAFYEIGGLKEELSKASKDENILKSKLDVLSTSEASALKDTNFAVSFLPGENPALLDLSALRESASTLGLLISNLKVGAGSKDASGFMKISISFDAAAPLEQIINFANLVKTSSPNIWIDEIDLSFVGDLSQASINMTSYWSPYPTKIPALTEPITSLNPSEKEILSKISSFSQPSFINLSPESPRENPNPFGE